MDTRPDGPRRIGERNQITLPAEQLREIGITAGDDVWITVNPDRPGTLVILPESTMSEIFRKGWVAVSG